MSRASRWGWTIAVLAVVAAGGWAAWKSFHKGDNGAAWRTETVDRGDVVQTVTATGTISPVNTVQVGSQVSGIIAALHADFNTPVHKGQLLAELDPTPLEATVAQRQADVDQAQVQLANSEIHLRRTQHMVDEKVSPESDLDDARAARDTAASQLAQAKAALEQARTNLGYTRIVSPVDGVVVARQYDVGQTVAASFQAPTLFTIAEDLTKMQVRADVDQADIARVRLGQEASFTVDSFPDHPFTAKVTQIRLNATVNQNVVTYPVIFEVANPDGVLKPDMTADVTVEVARATNVLRVPSAALRFRPPEGTAETGVRTGRGRGDSAGRRAEGQGGARPRASAQPADAEAQPQGGATPPGLAAGRPPGAAVYRLQADGRLERVPVRTGLSDGRFTEVTGGELAAGDKVVIGQASASSRQNATPSPFGGRGRF